MTDFKRTLREKNVTLINETRGILQCNVCHTRWSPNILEGGKFARGYWQCPEGCNVEGVKP